MKSKLILGLKLTITGTVIGVAVGASLWHWYKEPKIEVHVKETVKEVCPADAEACVSLTKWQLNKMLNMFEEDAHPSDSLKFKTIIKKDAVGWKLSSTHLAKGAEALPLPSGEFFVVDSNYIDHSGSFKDCIEYADSYKKFHNYVVVGSN
tara:strand:+ start:1327 stop:1776 length:450 start_codon:yes stop_codon:yes gene_type:complete